MLEKVLIDSDALQVCMAHALSTEKEEIMGLLVREVFLCSCILFFVFLENFFLQNLITTYNYTKIGTYFLYLHMFI